MLVSNYLMGLRLCEFNCRTNEFIPQQYQKIDIEQSSLYSQIPKLLYETFIEFINYIVFL
jgi:hypothetical protein